MIPNHQKPHLLPLLCMATVLSASFLSHATAQVHYDTVAVRPVGPGVTHYAIVAPQVPWSIHVLTVDLTSPYISIETAKANDRLAGREIVRSMAQRKGYTGHEAIGAINGDFYDGNGTPITIQLAQGEIVKSPVARPGIGFDSNGRPVIDVVSLSATVGLKDTTADIHRVNAVRVADNLVLYNPYFGSSTGTNQFGTEVLVAPLDGWLVNDTVRLLVENVVAGVGNMAIPAGKAVLSGHGTSSTKVLSRISTGDTLRLYQGIVPGPPRLNEMIGGNPKLVVNGTDVSYTAPREPRTAAGFSADSSTLYLIAADGRNPQRSVGMTFSELAQFMIGIGVYQGMNLDGGGSTTMIVRDEVANTPSDGSERAVSNGLLVISSAPSGTLTSVSLSPRSTRVFRGTARHFVLFGADQYGNPVQIDPEFIQYACTPSIGSIDSVTGEFVAGSEEGWGVVTAAYSGMTDSALVYVKPLGKLTLSPWNIVTDTTREIQYEYVTADVDDVPQAIPPEDLSWSVTVPSVGMVGTTGIFRGMAEGTTGVVATAGPVSDTVFVSVSIGSGYAVLNPMESLGDWSVSSSSVDSVAVSISDTVASKGSGSLWID